MTNTILLSDSFREFKEIFSTSPIKPFIVIDPVTKKQTSWIFQHTPSETSSYSQIKEIYKCHTCAKRHRQTSNVSDMDGPLIMCSSIVDKLSPTHVHYNTYKQIQKNCEIVCNNNSVDKLILVVNDTTFGFTPTEGRYYHIYRPINESDKTDSTIPKARLDAIINASNKYIRSGMFDDLVRKLTIQKRKSLALMIKCLDKLNCENNFSLAAVWLNKIAECLNSNNAKYFEYRWSVCGKISKEKWKFALEHIMSAKLSENSGEIIAEFFHIANDNIVNVLDITDERIMMEVCGGIIDQQATRFDEKILKIKPGSAIRQTIILTKDRLSWITIGSLPIELKEYGSTNFSEMFNLHPPERQKIIMYNKEVEVSRYQQSYLNTPSYTPNLLKSRSYMYSGFDTSKNNTDLPAKFKKYLDFVNSLGRGIYNQVTINWYSDGSDYIALHSDCEEKLKHHSPIIIITLNEHDTYLREFIIRSKFDNENVIYNKMSIDLENGTVITMGGNTQKMFMHGVPKAHDSVSRRISLSFRQIE